MKPLHPKHVRSARKLAAYSSIAAGALVASEEADAALISYFPTDTGQPALLRLGDSFDVDLDGDAIVDFTIDAVSHNYLGALGTLFEIEGSQTYGEQNLVSPAYEAPLGYVGMVNYGDVGPGTYGWYTNGPIFSTASGAGEFFGNRGWLGLYFEIPGSTPHFGFLDLEGTQEALVIHGGGFESRPETPIGRAPEPTSLALLALGAAGVAARRRRQKTERDARA